MELEFLFSWLDINGNSINNWNYFGALAGFFGDTRLKMPRSNIGLTH